MDTEKLNNEVDRVLKMSVRERTIDLLAKIVALEIRVDVLERTQKIL